MIFSDGLIFFLFLSVLVTAWMPDCVSVTWFFSPLCVMILNLLLLLGLTCHYTIHLRYFPCSVSAAVLLSVWLSDNTLSFNFTCQCICFVIINAEYFMGSYSATHSSFYRSFLRNNKISQDSSYLSWNTFHVTFHVTMKSCKDSLSVGN